MSLTLTETQKQRLRELDADTALAGRVFSDAQARDTSFKVMEKRLVEEERERLQELRHHRRRPAVCQIQEILTSKLTEEGFDQVITHIMITKKFLEKMSITASNPLTYQVFWLNKNNLLRPLLSPNLHHL